MDRLQNAREWLSNAVATSRPSLGTMRLGPSGSLQNPLMIQFFTWDYIHPTLSWWKHFEEEIPHLAELGFTQVWLPPPNKAKVPDGRGYDAYDLWDLGEFDQKGTIKTRWGTKDELVQACKVAERHGIDVLIDAILNHKTGADRLEKFQAVPVDPNNRLRDLGRPREIKGSTAYDFEGRAGKYSALRWSQKHFTGVDRDHKTGSKNIFCITGPGHKGWSTRVDKELGNYDYLLGADIDHRHPDVRHDLFNWGAWVLETTGATGFRIDAVKHMDRHFIRDFLGSVHHVPGRGNMFTVSEYWSSDVRTIIWCILSFQGKSAFFDVPLHFNFHLAGKRGSAYDLRGILSNTLLAKRPGDAVTFVDNHDTVPSQSLASWVSKDFKIHAYAIILLRGTGHPCVFYGDLYPNREYDEDTARDLRVLVDVCRKHAYGAMREYMQDRNRIGFVRLGDSERKGCAVVLSNSRATGTVRMNVGQGPNDKTYITLLQPTSCLKVDPDGWAAFPCTPKRVQVWVEAG